MRTGAEPSRARILAVDDEPDMLAILRILFSTEGWVVTTASNGEEALRWTRRLPPDLIITDYDMPGMSGLELCRQLRAEAQTHAIPIILHTGIATIPPGSAPHLYDRMLIKPTDLDVLITEVRALLRVR